MEFLQLELTHDSPVAGKPMSQLDLPEDTAVPLLMRNGGPVVVHADTVLQPDDKLIAVATAAQESALRDYVLGPDHS